MFRIDFAAQPHALGFGHRLEQRQDLAREVAHVGALRVELQFSGLDLGQIKDVVDQVEQDLPASPDRRHPFALQRFADVVAEQLRKSEDRVHWRADLVAHAREERAFFVVRAARLGSVQFEAEGIFGLQLRAPQRQEAQKPGHQRQAVGDQ